MAGPLTPGIKSEVLRYKYSEKMSHKVKLISEKSQSFKSKSPCNNSAMLLIIIKFFLLEAQFEYLNWIYL